jgi:hypothetical protein
VNVRDEAEEGGGQHPFAFAVNCSRGNPRVLKTASRENSN